MAQRYVRIKTLKGQILYGLLRLNHEVQILDAPAWLGGQPTETRLQREGYRILAPCAPSKIVAVGLNYRLHALEMGKDLPSEPLIFLKPPSSIIAHEQGIIYPTQSQRVEFEGELALVIGDRTDACTEEEAYKKIWGYTIANDVTARDLQHQDSQWTRAKSFNTFCPLGPWIVRELSSEAKLHTYVNDAVEPRQSTSIQDMVFSCTQLVAYISQIMTLLPGDVVLTGTPAGVGAVKVGDRLRIEIEGIGQLENEIIAPETKPLT